MNTSPEGRGFIEGRESLVLTEYADENKPPVMTIGYGHRQNPGDPKSITKVQADAILSNDLRVAESAVNSLVMVPLTQIQFDVLVSFVFNVGGTSFAESTLLKLLNQGDYEGAADELPRWCHVLDHGVKVVSKGLLARRNAERARFRGAKEPDTDPELKA